MTEEGLTLLVYAVGDEREGGYEGGEENQISGEVDNVCPPSRGTFDVDIELL